MAVFPFHLSLFIKPSAHRPPRRSLPFLPVEVGVRTNVHLIHDLVLDVGAAVGDLSRQRKEDGVFGVAAVPDFVVHSPTQSGPLHHEDLGWGRESGGWLWVPSSMSRNGCKKIGVKEGVFKNKC